MWYNKFDLKKRDGHIECPNCKYVYEEQIFYSLDNLPCQKCGTQTLFIRTKSFIYIFNLKKAPALFIRIIEDMRTKPMKEAYSQLMEITEVFSLEHNKADELY